MPPEQSLVLKESGKKRYPVVSFGPDGKKMIFALLTKVIALYIGLTTVRSGNLAFKNLLQGLSGKISGWRARAGVLVFKTVLKIRWRFFLEYLAIELVEARSGARMRVGARDTTKMQIRVSLSLVRASKAVPASSSSPMGREFQQKLRQV